MAKRKRLHAAEKLQQKSAKIPKQEVKIKPVRHSDDPHQKKPKWINKQRVLIFSSRGISFRDRHLMSDLRTLLPHSKPDTKMDRKDKLLVVNEICEMKNCNKCIFFEAKKKKDLYMWVSSVPRGPSVKFLIENVHTMEELKMTGNCLKGSRPLLSFDKNFDTQPHYAIIKEIFIQTFSTPNHHPKSQPFVDHVLTFSILDNRIWFRNYQILEEDGSLAEIGPRFVLNPIRIFEGSFGGPTLFENPQYISPNQYRKQLKLSTADKYKNKQDAKTAHQLRHAKQGNTYKVNPTDDIFQTLPPEEAVGVEKKMFSRKRSLRKIGTVKRTP
ncbi:PREDICTED: ribosome biogenesis protein BRX1 homolog [Priapulus caudatus]|uniref:Ribosome biogenesis protein BRX1 homolog n=1 Tax=Priapulus caudatus TaxID=37621 RepID=A0ABM1DNA0_PRICU|nr:PREDICTED: ribosome biogenesis protein BRX1 homolog [Priapulus caudatus]